MATLDPPECKGIPEMRLGRNLRAGYQRGWGLQFGTLVRQIRDDPLYQTASFLAAGRPIVSDFTRMNIYLILRTGLANMPRGQIVEFGSWRGCNAIFMARVAKELYPGMQVYVFDTFAGIPEPDRNRDLHAKGDFADADNDGLVMATRAYGLDNLHLVRGLFQDTPPHQLPAIGPIVLNHIDCDIYSAVTYSYEATLPYMVEGGYWVFDDALVSSCLGATEAIEEFLMIRDRRHSEQIFPHFVFRNYPPDRTLPT